MQKTRIDWADYSINPVKGICKNNCWYCYAIRMYKRFGWDPEIKFSKKTFKGIEKIKEPSRIFICSTNDLFGSWVEDRWIEFILSIAIVLPQHTFIFLTKFPGRYKDFDFPKNCWLGTTLTGGLEDILRVNSVLTFLQNKNIDNIKFISFEPCLETDDGYEYNLFAMIDWLIIGGLTGYKNYNLAKIHSGLKRIIGIVKGYGVPIFIKDNLNWPEKIREFPKII